MPNGESRNWVRLQITLETFHALYGKWPTTIRLYPFFIDGLKKKLSPKDFQTLQSKIKLVPDQENPFLCYDADGNQFDYAHGGNSVPKEKSSVKAIDWLGINEPDYYD